MTVRVMPKITKKGIQCGYLTLPEQKGGVQNSRDPGLAHLQLPTK